MSPEGELCLRVAVAGGRVLLTRVESTRPDIGRTLLQGRSGAEITAAVPHLYAICGASQGAAAALVCAAASGSPISAGTLQHAGAAVDRETLAEHARCVLLQWTQWLGEAPAGAALAAARAAHARRGAAAAADPEADNATAAAGAAVARAAFAMPAEEWLAIATPAGLRRWAGAGETAAARFVARQLDDAGEPAAAAAPATVPLLPVVDHARLAAALAPSIEADARFVQQPLWRGVPAEAGPLARLQHDVLVAALMQAGVARAPLRWVARLRELALLACRRVRMAVGVHGLPGGAAIAWVENARGLLLHLARIGRDGRADLYRIVAPTEWNFHPQGALPRALAGVAANDPAALEAGVTAQVRSLDPCVGWRMELAHA